MTQRAGERWQPVAIDGIPDGLILFDGVCVFCSRWVQFVIARDAAARFRFAPIQSRYGAIVAARLGISLENPQTNAVVLAGRAYFKSDAALMVLSRLPRWSRVRLLRSTPRPLRDGIYDRIARSRYRLYGRTDHCLIPGPEIASRFVADEAAGKTG